MAAASGTRKELIPLKRYENHRSSKVIHLKFHVCNIEPKGYAWGHFLDDFCRLMCYSLESIGHSCSMGCNQIDAGRINIVFGGNMLVSPDHAKTLANVCSYIAVQHEVNADGIILGEDADRFNSIYLPFLGRALAVWEGIPRNLTLLQRLGLKTAFFRGGYHPALDEVRPRLTREIDFLFYGSMTPYRQRMMERLSERGYHVVTAFDSRAAYRNDLIGRAHISVAPIQGVGLEHFAYGRVCYLLNNRSLVVVERCEDQEWLESCFVSTSTERWVDICEQTLLRDDRDAIREEFCERYRAMPFTEQLERLLEATFSNNWGGDSCPPAPGGREYEQATQAVAQTS